MERGSKSRNLPSLSPQEYALAEILIKVDRRRRASLSGKPQLPEDEAREEPIDVFKKCSLLLTYLIDAGQVLDNQRSELRVIVRAALSELEEIDQLLTKSNARLG